MNQDLKVTQQNRTGFFADCSREEFERRIGRIREEMEQAQVDGVLLTQETNVRYSMTVPIDVIGWPVGCLSRVT